MSDEQSDFISCDWGTTNFRIRLIEGGSHRVLTQIHESHGVKTLHETVEQNEPLKREEIFTDFLRRKINELLRERELKGQTIPMVISGMASSTIGWRELPYAKAPLAINGTGLVVENIHWEKPAMVGTTLLVSGVMTEADMMRGEETQIIGLLSQPAFATYGKSCVMILPGTHSKHVSIEENRMVTFSTYMTGELFEVLGKHSILASTVASPQNLETPTRNSLAGLSFKEGLQSAISDGLSKALFGARSRAVLLGRPKIENSFYLSGVLLGAELGPLCKGNERPIVLAAPDAISGLYNLALELISPPDFQWVTVTSECLGRATVVSHRLILEQHVTE